MSEKWLYRCKYCGKELATDTVCRCKDAQFEKAREKQMELTERRRLHHEHMLVGLYSDNQRNKRDFMNGRLNHHDAIESIFDTLSTLIDYSKKNLG